MADAVVAWRCWNARPSGQLHSVGYCVYNAKFWPIGERAEAACSQAGRAPCANGTRHYAAVDCHSGIHAWKERERAERQHSILMRRPYFVVLGNATPIYGRVSLWGRVIEHEDGYRAQYAYPLELLVPREQTNCLLPFDPRTLAATLRTRWRCDVEVL